MDALKDPKCPAACIPTDSGDENPTAPGYMNAIVRQKYLQERVKSLPAPIQNRITILKNMQLEHLQLEVEFFEELLKLEQKYQYKNQPFYDKRREIITGEIDPPKEEPKWQSKDAKQNELEECEKMFEFPKEMETYNDETKGVPDFWLNVFRSNEMISNMIEEHDEPVLRKLIDIKIAYDDDRSFRLEFHFDRNDYFTNRILTQKFFLKTTSDDEHPFDFFGLEIYKCIGCVISWEKGKNLTIKTVRKGLWKKDSETCETIIKQVPNDSFFNIFNPPQIPNDNDEIDDELQTILTTYFEIGHILRERVIPKAILYYTGDIIDDEDDESEDDSDDESCCECECDEEEKLSEASSKSEEKPETIIV